MTNTNDDLDVRIDQMIAEHIDLTRKATSRDGARRMARKLAGA